MTDEKRLQVYNTCLVRFDQWVDENLADDGCWVQPATCVGYFSIPPYATYMGRFDMASRALRHIHQRYITDDGGVIQSDMRKNMLPYMPAWLLWGAVLGGSLKMVNVLADFIVSYQCPSTGSFFGTNRARDHQKGYVDFDSTAMAVFALACAGRVEPSVRGAEFLVELYEVQSAPERVIYTAWADSGGLVKDDENAAHTLCLSEPEQHYYKIGLWVMALVRAYSVSGRQRLLDFALAIYRRTVIGAPGLWANTTGHKMAWAASTLYTTTDDPRYLEDACRMADHLATVQQPDGGFHYPEFWPTYPPDPWELQANVGFQFALWIAQARDGLVAKSKDISV